MGDDVHGENSIRLPGFGLGLAARENISLKFPIAVTEDRYYDESTGAPLLSLREYNMMNFMNLVTDKPDWEKKCFDETVTKKWKSEAAATPDWGFSDKMANWCVEELKYKAEVYKTIACVETLDGVWKSDIIVPEDLKTALQKAVAPLENVLDKEKDWHPGSNEQVLDLVHPSVYSLVYGQTKILPNDTCGLDDCVEQCGNGVTLQEQTKPEVHDAFAWSETYQWLPSEFETPDNTDDVKITSYINNLHPQRNKDLYSVVERVVSKAIPLWDRTLTPLLANYTVPPRINLEAGGFLVKDERWQEEDEAAEDYYDRLDAWRDNIQINYPEPGDFKPPAERLEHPHKGSIASPDLHPSFQLRRFSKMQIIVKITSVELTPEKPTYPGGSWHVEGKANESICAIALYYYSNHNISDSSLSFRVRTDSGINLPYVQNDFRALEIVCGFQNEGPEVQDLGSVLTPENRLLTFPNTMQHRVGRFSLADPTKSGRRKILALFLVDPHIPIIGTKNVPCQQQSWWRECVQNTGRLGTLPMEIRDHIFGFVEWPISLAETKKQREGSLDERKYFSANIESSLRNALRLR